jgi:hypothetical protein
MGVGVDSEFRFPRFPKIIEVTWVIILLANLKGLISHSLMLH